MIANALILFWLVKREIKLGVEFLLNLFREFFFSTHYVVFHILSKYNFEPKTYLMSYAEKKFN